MSMFAHLYTSFSVIGISETWLNDQNQDFAHLPGYNFVSNHRNGKTGGGVGLFLQNNLEYKVLKDCYFSDPEIIESIFVEIMIPHGKNIIVGTIYRPPNHNLPGFLAKCNELISIISSANKHCYIMGDFNLDLLSYNDHAPTQEFMDSLFSHMFFPLISKPTRITSHSATLIDNIFTNHISSNFRSGIILNDISDHLPIFALSTCDPLPPIRTGNFISRVFSEANNERFRSSLSDTDWSSIISVSSDPSVSFDSFIAHFKKIYDDCFPIKVIKKRKSKVFSPWITNALLVSVRQKNRLYKKFIKNPSPTRETRYKAYKNKLNHLIRIAKRDYYDQQFKNVIGNMKKTWKLINEVINRRTNSNASFPSSFKSDGNQTEVSFPIPPKLQINFVHILLILGQLLQTKFLIQVFFFTRS